MKPIPIGPWPLGADNVADEQASVFQLSKGKAARLRAAVNVNLDDDGWPERRAGMALAYGAQAARTAVSLNGMLLLQDGGRIVRLLPAPQAVLVSGLGGAPVRFCAFQRQVFWSDGSACGCIDRNGAATNWGLAVPAVSASAVAGTLAAGTYRVAATFVDAAGREGGAAQAAALTLTSPGALRVAIPVRDPNARYVEIYASAGANQPDLFWCRRVALGHVPVTLSDLRISTRPLRTQHLRGPVAGAGLFTYRGYLLTWSGARLYRSQPKAPHLWDLRTQRFIFPGTVRTALALADGFYVGTDAGLFWVAGEDPAAWRVLQVDDRVYLAGGRRLAARKLPALQAGGVVALLASRDGLMVGLPGGQVMAATDGRLALPGTATAASIAYREAGKYRQVLMALT